MATILEKLRTVVLGNAHAILDKVIDENSIPVLKQNLRDLEAAIASLEEQAAQAEGEMVTAQHQVTALTAQTTEINHNIDFILGDGDASNDDQALPMQARLIGLEEQLKTAQSELDNYKQTMEAVDHVCAALKAQKETRLHQINLLESQTHATAAKDKAAKAIEMANKFSGAGGPSVDNIAQRIETQSNIADARLKRAMGTMETSLGQDALLAQARARLAERKAEINKG